MYSLEDVIRLSDTRDWRECENKSNERTNNERTESFGRRLKYPG